MTEPESLPPEQAQIAEALLSRRRLLATGTGLTAAGLVVGAAGIGTPAAGAAESPVVQASGPGPFGTGALGGAIQPGAETATFPIPQPGCTIRTVGASVFSAAGVSSGSTLVGVPGPPWGAYNSSSNALFAPLDIPPGSVLQQVDCYAYATTTGTDSFRKWFLMDFDNQGGEVDVAPAVTGPAGSIGLKQVTFGKLDYTVGANHQILADLAVSSATYYAVAVTYQYQPAQPGFVPITPTRVYDSRWSPAPATVTTGVLTAPASRAVSVADGRSIAGGAITVPNVVPVGARAVTYNLTAAAVSSTGFLSITPGDAVSFSASAVNWSMPGAIANGGVVPLDADRKVKLWAGVGSANVILDITGYYL